MKKNDLFSLDGRIIVITGAAGVLAGAAASHLARQGAHLELLDLRKEAVDEKVGELRRVTDRVAGHACDVLDQRMLEEVHGKIRETHGRIDVLINGAGGNRAGAYVQDSQSLFDMDMDEYRKVMDLNLNGTLFPALEFGKSMAEQKKGSVINFSSMAAAQSITRVPGYSAAKASVENLTRWLAMELAVKFGGDIRVNAVAPGFFITIQNRHVLLEKDGSLTERSNLVIRNTPMGRFGEPEELCGIIHFLASEASSFITGTVIPVDGGFSSFSGV